MLFNGLLIESPESLDKLHESFDKLIGFGFEVGLACTGFALHGKER